MSFFSNLSTLFQDKNKDKNQGRKDKKRSRKQQSHQPQAKNQHNSQGSRPRPKPQTQGSAQARQAAQTSQASPQASRTKQQFSRDKEQQAKRLQKLKQEQAEAKQQIESMLREAKAKAREVIVEAKDQALEIKAKAEQKAREQEQELTQRSRTLDQKIDKLDRRLDAIESKEQAVTQEQVELEHLRTKLQTQKTELLQRLEQISGMTQQEAEQTLLSGLEKKLTVKMAQIVRQKTEESRQEAKLKAKETLIDAMRHGATDYVAEYTVSVVKIPSEDVKGKIIGKSGRNIHAFERETGVDLDLDYSKTEVRLSCFNSVRREIARQSLERLIKDGRIQPARIEKTVRKVRSEVQDVMLEAGKDLCQRVGVYNLPTKLVQALGRFKYRFSYGQNLIKHTLEVTKIGTYLAHELDLDVNVVKLGCLLHDIGKVADKQEGGHAQLGVKMIKRYGLPKEVEACIAQHHEDQPFSGPEQMVVYIADAISGARPGARYENLDEYVERLENLEKIATSHSEVEEAYAVKAGREIRVMLDPEKSKEDDVTILAHKISDKIESELTYPGTVTVNVIREMRSQATAK
jgi:ribonuclease Y